jgi:hypothetical protein
MAYRTINPFTEELVKEYPPHTPEQIEEALWESDIRFQHLPAVLRNLGCRTNNGDLPLSL